MTDETTDPVLISPEEAKQSIPAFRAALDALEEAFLDRAAAEDPEAARAAPAAMARAAALGDQARAELAARSLDL
ncbi:hypothetical protein [Kitasatospora sp. NPDC087315]|uniref:hypothetical protein n=1 Tax=Kitasatospora sp. NPDC087315 TaxID=3364069 RepID=UPI00380357FA